MLSYVEKIGSLFSKHRTIYPGTSEDPDAERLLQAVEDADYEKAQELIALDPTIMFQPILFRFRDERVEDISPLAYAFKVYDTYMWKGVFLKKIATNQELVERFYQIMERQEWDPFDFTSLFNNYAKYVPQLKQWGNLPNATRELGKTQRLIPAHMLKEFSREEPTWSTNATFDADSIARPTDCRFYSYQEFSLPWKSFTRVLSDPNWGYALIRILEHERGAIAKDLYISATARVKDYWPWGSNDATLAAQHDLETFLHLLEVRKREFANSLLLIPVDYHLKQKDQRPARRLGSSSTG